MYQFSLRSMFVVTFFCGLTFMAIELRSPFFSAFLQFVHACAVAFALVGAMVSTSSLRVFCLGYLVCGWGYSIAVFPEWRFWQPSSGQAIVVSGASSRVASEQSVPASHPVALLFQLIDLYISARPGKTGFSVGDPVMAQWSNGSWYSAVISQATKDGQFTVAWDDGSTATIVTRAQMKPGKPNYLDHQVAGHSVLAPAFGLFGAWLVGAIFGQQPADEQKGLAPCPAGSRAHQN